MQLFTSSAMPATGPGSIRNWQLLTLYSDLLRPTRGPGAEQQKGHRSEDCHKGSIVVAFSFNPVRVQQGIHLALVVYSLLLTGMS